MLFRSDTLLLFITPPTAQELRSRLVGRGTETLDVIESRMDRACEEAEGMDQYDYLIVNDDLDTCVEEVHQIIRGEHHRSTRNTGFMEKIKEDLNSLKGERVQCRNDAGGKRVYGCGFQYE